MIAFLSGKVIGKQERTIVLNVNGIGYLVHVARGAAEKINEGSELSLYIHTHVREDDISLFGFGSREEWGFFKLLLTVSGVGPKSALEILNAPIDRIKQAIVKKDTAPLTQIPGIGKKTAERIIVDLQGKIKEELIYEKIEDGDVPVREDIMHALIALGYHRNQVIHGLKKIPVEIDSEEAIIKYFLQHI